MMEAVAPISKRPSCILWSEIEKWTPESVLLRFGKLPEGWRLLPVGAFAAQLDNKEKVKPESEYRMAGVRWYGEGVFHRETVVGKEQSANYLCPLKPGAIIYNRLFAWKESFAVVPEDLNGYYVSNEFPQFEIDQAIALPKYVYLLFNTKKIIGAVNAASIGSAAISRNRFKESDFLGFKVPIPPLPIQQKIVAHWEAAQLEQSQLLMKEQGLIKESQSTTLALLGIKKIEGKPVGKMFCLPWKDSERWSYEYNKRVLAGLSSVVTGSYPAIPLNSICTGVSGSTPSKKRSEYWADGTLPWVSPKDMKTRLITDSIDHISDNAVKERQAPVAAPGSILFVVRSGILQHTVPVAMTDISVSINQDIRAFTPNTENILAEYLLAYFEAKQDELLRLVKWSTTVQSINKEELESFPIPFPPVSKQKEIISTVRSYHVEIDSLRQNRNTRILGAEREIEKMILGTRPVEAH